ncbi:2-dehydro-3-deoxygalactonokinase [Brevundimonas sp. TWP2-3-4b1]|uniref:2-dehydro-3-deoxygalactonokinase n=1 Tax=Brevundimonas sp. TWP2-3-4b1 TaxID=2804580 RepID=UPI003CEC509D
MSEEIILGLEWGLAALRAHWIAPDGHRLATIGETFALDPRDRPTAEARLKSVLDRGPVPVRTGVLCGMGAALFEGDVPWLRTLCPATPEQLGTDLVFQTFAGVDLGVSRGLRCLSLFGDPDVLRGEEAAALGLIDRQSGPGVLLSVPGRHGKWIVYDAGAIQSFHTAMTVELRQLLAQHSIVGRGWTPDGRAGPAFFAGLERGLAGHGLPRAAFVLRSAVVAGDQTAAEAGDAAWGLLIGADLGDALPKLRQALGGVPVTVAGAPSIAALYKAALIHLEVTVSIADADDLAARGLRRLWTEAGRHQVQAA